LGNADPKASLEVSFKLPSEEPDVLQSASRIALYHALDLALDLTLRDVTLASMSIIVFPISANAIRVLLAFVGFDVELI
jgi:hypothetical protein